MKKPALIKPAGWAEYFEFLMLWEGEKLENVPGDNGGLTKYGIDQRSHPNVEIAKLTRPAAKRIHLEDYFKTDSARLPEPLCFAFFDHAMNAGNSSAVKVLQRTVGATADGVWGPLTQARVDSFFRQNAVPMFLVKFMAERETFYKNLAHTSPKHAKFLKGWLNRTAACKKWCGARLQSEGGK